MSLNWEGSDKAYVFSDVYGEGKWVRLYPNACGNFGVPSEIEASEGVHLPINNGFKNVFTLEPPERSFTLTSVVVQETSETATLIESLTSLPSVCDGANLQADSLKQQWNEISVQLDEATSESLALSSNNLIKR